MNTNGIGLGLVISNQIVQQFGGQFQVVSSPGEGSSFIFTFRLAANLEEVPRPGIAQNPYQVNSNTLYFGKEL